MKTTTKETAKEKGPLKPYEIVPGVTEVRLHELVIEHDIPLRMRKDGHIITVYPEEAEPEDPNKI